MWKTAISPSTILGALALTLMAPRAALAWGNEGHEVVALIAQAYLDPPVRKSLIGHISEDQVRDWSQGSASDWALDSFKIAKDDAYGQLPEPSSKHIYRLSDDYMATATQDVAIQLSKGGVRLAFILNKALGQNR